MATVRINGKKHWVADYRDQRGKRHREAPEGTFENKALEKMAAQELLAKRPGEIDKATYHPATRHRTFSDLCAHFLDNYVFTSPSTRREYDGSIEGSSRTSARGSYSRSRWTTWTGSARADHRLPAAGAGGAEEAHEEGSDGKGAWRAAAQPSL
jgi:hypothetical protein